MAEYEDTTYIELFASSSKRRPVQVQLVVTAYKLLTGECLSRTEYDRTLAANGSSELIKFSIPANYEDVKNPVVVGARLIDPESQTTLAGLSLWPEPCASFTSSYMSRESDTCQTGTNTSRSLHRKTST